MIESDKDLVERLYKFILAHIGQDRFDVWFRDQVAFQIDTKTLRIFAPDDFILDQLRRRFGKLVLEAGRQVVGASIRFEWKAATDVKKPVQPQASNSPESPIGDESLERVDDLGVQGELKVQLSPEGENESQATLSSSADSEPATNEPSEFHSDDTFSPIVSPTPPETKLLRIHKGNDTALAPSKSEKASSQVRTGRFDNFVSGEHCRLAFTAASHVSKKLGEVSPLYLYGPTGVGKTHLLQAIQADVRRRSRARCVLLSAEQFTTGFLEALHGRGLPSFRRKYRNTDVLLLDDIQFFVGKRATLVELFYTIDALVLAGKQIVLASDRPPNELNGVGSEVIARLSAGLTCGIEHPVGPAKRDLVQHLAVQRGELLSTDVIDLLAEELPGDARRIRGAVNRLVVIRKMTGEPPTVNQARRELGDLFQSHHRPLGMQDIERAVCEVFGVESKLLRSDRKTKTVSQPRMLAMWLARKHTKAAFSEIGEFFGGRSHSTVISAHHKVERWVGDNSDVKLANGASSVTDTIRRIESTLRAV